MVSLILSLHNAAYRPPPKAAARKWSGFDLGSQDLQPDNQVNHSDDQRGSHERFRRSAWRVNHGCDQHVRPGDLQGASQRLLSRWGVRPLPVTAGDFAEGRRAVLRDAADPGSCRVAHSGGRAAGRVPGGIQHASFGQVERGPGAGDCRARWGDGRAGLRALEPCRSFTPNRQTRRLEVRPRKCLHYYLYRIDPEFGWMHVRLQTPTRSRSTSTSGWRGRWTGPASAI